MHIVGAMVMLEVAMFFNVSTYISVPGLRVWLCQHGYPEAIQKSSRAGGDV